MRSGDSVNQQQQVRPNHLSELAVASAGSNATHESVGLITTVAVM